MGTTAARLVKHDKPLVIEDIELGPPAAGERLVKMHYGGINPVDRYNAIGRVNADAPLPRTLGMEGVGTSGERMVLIHGHGLGTNRDGVWSTEAVVPADALIEVPTGVSTQNVAAMGVAGVTAWRTVTELAKVDASDRVLVLGPVAGWAASWCQSPTPWGPKSGPRPARRPKRTGSRTLALIT
jgi:NADPH:quinone reductase-like Zn-dependent oxidoreductase